MTDSSKDEIKKKGSFILPIHPDSEYLKNPSEFFIGRSSLKSKLTNAIIESDKSGGCFLIGGYRGVGKSSLVSSVVDKLNGKFDGRECISIKLNVGDPGVLNFRGVLTDSIAIIVNNISKKIEGSSSVRYSLVFFHFIIFSLLMCAFVFLPKALIEDCPILFRDVLYTSFFFIFSFYIFWSIFCLRKRFDAIEYENEVEKIIVSPFCFPASGLDFFYGGFLCLFVVFVLFCIFQLPNSFLLYFPALFFISEIACFFGRVDKFTQLNSLKRELEKLQERVQYDRVIEGGGQINSTLFRVFARTSLSRQKISDRELEFLLANIIENYHKTVKFIFVFDELDKLGSIKFNDEKSDKKDLIESFLSRAKEFLRIKHCVFIFIGDREIVDSYYSESGSKNALYEGIFDQIFYVPSLLSDYSDRRPEVMHSMVMEYLLNVLYPMKDNTLAGGTKLYSSDGYAELGNEKGGDARSLNNSIERAKKMMDIYIEYIFGVKDTDVVNGSEYSKDSRDYKNIQYVLNRFARFLTVHSWGNCRRLQVLINQFIEEATDENITRHREQCIYTLGEDKDRHKSDAINKKFYLHIDGKDMARVLFSANLYEMISWEMGDRLSGADDKLLISTLNSTIDLMKFHELPFSRNYLDRTSEGIDVLAEPHLTGAVGQLIDAVSYPFVRKLNRSLHDYRFYSHLQYEIKFISKTIGAKASSYVFGLSSHDDVRNYYIKQLSFLNEGKDGAHSQQARAVTMMILGDIYSWERSYDKSIAFFSDAVATLKMILREPDQKDWRHNGGPSFSSHYLLCRALLKKGCVAEARNNYQLAWRLYREAMDVAKESFAQKNSNGDLYSMIREVSLTGNVRHRDVLILSALALSVVYLKSNQKQERDINLSVNLDYLDVDQQKQNRLVKEVRVMGKDKQNYMDSIDKDIIFQTQSIRYFSNDFSGINEEFDSVYLSFINKRGVNGFLHLENALHFSKKWCCNGKTLDLLTCQNIMMWLNSKLIVASQYLINDKDRTGPNTSIFRIVNILTKKKLVPDVHDKGSKYFSRACLSTESFKPETFDLHCYLFFLHSLASHLVSLGYMTQANFIYSSGAFSMMALLDNPTYKTNSRRKKLRDLMDDFLHLHARANKVLDHGLFKFQREIWESEKSQTSDEDFRGRLEYFLKKGELTFWHQSQHKNTNIVLSFWNWIIHDDVKYLAFFEHIKNGFVLPQYQKNVAVLFWLKGRYHLEKFKASKSNVNGVSKDLIVSINYLIQSIEHNEKIVGCGATPSWPPKIAVLTDVLEALSFYVPMAEGNNKTRVSVVQELERKFEAKALHPYLDGKVLYELIVCEINNIRNINDKNSPYFLHLIKDKMFLHDDFRDPEFINEWLFMHILSAKAKILEVRANKLYDNYHSYFNGVHQNP